jgi:arylsulfatase B
VEEAEYLTDAFTREAISFIERHKKQPFFLELSYNAVHSPMQGADDYMEKFTDIEDIQRRIFAAMLANMDSSVGTVMQKLEELDLLNNTLVIFFSDNGGPTLELTSSNLPLRGGKGSMFEGGLRIPFMMQWKEKLPAGVVYDPAITSMDLLPTCVAAAGINPAGGLDGVNLLPYLSGERKGNPHELFFWRQGRKKALRKGEWKVVYDPRSQEWELFNLSEDPGEKENLMDRFPDKGEALKAEWESMNLQMMEPLF